MLFLKRWVYNFKFMNFYNLIVLYENYDLKGKNINMYIIEKMLNIILFIFWFQETLNSNIK